MQEIHNGIILAASTEPKIHLTLASFHFLYAAIVIDGIRHRRDLRWFSRSPQYPRHAVRRHITGSQLHFASPSRVRYFTGTTFYLETLKYKAQIHRALSLPRQPLDFRYALGRAIAALASAFLYHYYIYDIFPLKLLCTALTFLFILLIMPPPPDDDDKKLDRYSPLWYIYYRFSCLLRSTARLMPSTSLLSRLRRRSFRQAKILASKHYREIATISTLPSPLWEMIWR